MKKKFDLFVSIGAACSCSNALRVSNLQFRSYPFDWISGADFNKRIQLLTNDFEDWLNINSMEYIAEREHPVPSKIYKNTKTGIIFSHDFPKDKEINESFNDVKVKYDRRIKRLIKQIETSKKVLFVYTMTADSDEIINDSELKRT